MFPSLLKRGASVRRQGSLSLSCVFPPLLTRGASVRRQPNLCSNMPLCSQTGKCPSLTCLKSGMWLNSESDWFSSHRMTNQRYGMNGTILLGWFIHYLLTPWCRVLLEKLTGLQLVKKFPTFHGIRKFITALKSVRHLSLSWTSPIQSIYPHPTSWRYPS